jgi:hypothetical protein
MKKRAGAPVKKGEGAKNKRAERRGAKYGNTKPAGVTKRSSDPKKKKPIIKTDGKPAGKSKEEDKEGKGKDSAPQDDQKKTYNKPNGDLIQVRHSSLTSTRNEHGLEHVTIRTRCATIRNELLRNSHAAALQLLGFSLCFSFLYSQDYSHVQYYSCEGIEKGEALLSCIGCGIS